LQRAGTWPALQSAARAALKQQARERGTHRARPPPVPGQPAGEVPSAYAVLELSNVPSTEREVTRAYRLAAAKWHPDKWASAGEEERRESERRWAEISTAYETCLAEAEG
jgi:DnaJ-class molecular chaperone